MGVDVYREEYQNLAYRGQFWRCLSNRRVYRRVCQLLNEINNVGTLNEALDILKKQPFDVILSDPSLPDSDGVNTFFRIHNENPLIPIIILTGLKDETIGTYAIKEGAHDYLVKGQTESRLLECIIQCSIKCKNRLYSDY